MLFDDGFENWVKENADGPIYDLGGAFGCPEGWTSVDLNEPAEIRANLNERWPFDDGSVAAFRAHDIIEHLTNKCHTMAELHRCLKPGGWALIRVPSTDGRGAFQDPTHVTYWNENNFWYWTRETSRYINGKIIFVERRLCTLFPTPWHEDAKICYCVADLQKI